MVHHLQKNVVNIAVGFFNLIKQDYRIRVFDNRVGEQTALIEAYVARRCTNQATHGMTLHVLRHIETYQLNAHNFGQLLSYLGFPYAGRTSKQERTNRFLFGAKTRAGQVDGIRQRLNRFILTEYHHFQVTAQIFKHFFI